MNRTKFIFFFSLLFFFGKNFLAQLSGTYNVPGNYPTIAAAITDLNSQGISGSVLITVNAAHTETAPIGGYTLTATGTAANNITFQKIGAGTNPLINAYTGGVRTPGTAIQDGIWSLIGSDYVTIDGIDLFDPNASNPSSMEYGFGFFKANAGNGCQNNTIRNCVVTLQRLNNAIGTAPATDGSRGINVVNSLYTTQTSVLTVTSSLGANSNNSFYGNTIQNCNIGIALIGYAAPSPFILADTNNDVGGNSIASGNTIVNYGGAAGATNPAAAIRTLAQYNINVSYNTITNNNGAGVNHPTTLRGIFLNTATSANASITNNTLSIKGGGSTSQVSLIENLSGATAANNTISITNNLIFNNTNVSNTTGTWYGIFNNVASSAYLNVSANTFSTTTNTASSGSLYYIYNTGAVTNLITYTNNLFAQCSNTATSTGSSYFIFNNAVATASLLVSGNQFLGNTCSQSAGASYLIFNAAASAGNISIANNLVHNHNFTASGAGAFVGIQNAGTTGNGISLSNNTFSNSTLSTNGGSTFWLYNTAGISGTIDFSNNLFSGLTSSISAAGSYYGIYNNAASASSLSINNNTFQSNANSASTGSVHLIYNRGAVTNTFVSISMNNNAVTNSTITSASTSPFLGIYNSGVTSNNLNVNSNTFNNNVWNSASSTKYLLLNNGPVLNAIHFDNNLLSSLTLTANTTGSFFGVANNASAGSSLSITNNTLTASFTRASTGSVFLISNTGISPASSNISNNTFANWSHLSSSTGGFYCLYNQSANSSTIQLSNNLVSTNSIQISGGTAAFIFNTGAIANTITAISVTNNLFSGNTASVTAGGNFYGVINNNAAASGLDLSSNTFTNNSFVTANGGTYLLYNSGAATYTFNTINFQNNLIAAQNFSSTSTGPFFMLFNNTASSGGLSVTNNTLTNCSWTGTASTKYMISNTGSVSASGINFRNNILANTTTSNNSTGAFYGFHNAGNTTADVTMADNVFSDFINSATTGFTYLFYNGSSVAGNRTFTNNTISNVQNSTSGNADFYGMFNSGNNSSLVNFSSNTFTTISVSSTSGSSYFLNNTGPAATTIGTIQIANNTVSQITNSITLGGSFYGLYNNGVSATNLIFSGNSFANCISTASTGATHFIYNRGVLTNTFASITIISNTIGSSTLAGTGNGTVYKIFNSGVTSANTFISGNTINGSLYTTLLSPRYFIFNTGVTTGQVTISNNAVTNITSTLNTTGLFYGVNNAASAANGISITTNTISNSQFNATTGDAFLIHNSGAGAGSTQIVSNLLSGLSINSFGAGVLYGIYNNGASSGSLSIQSNSLLTSSRTSSNGATYLIYNRGTVTNTYNLISMNSNLLSALNFTTLGNGAHYGIYNNGVRTASLTMNTNTLQNIDYASTVADRYLVINSASVSAINQIGNNFVNNISSNLNTTAGFYGLLNASTGTASAVLSISTNTLSNLQVSATSGVVQFISNTGNLNGGITINNNSLGNYSVSSSGAGNIFSIYNTGPSLGSLSIQNNLLNNALTNHATGSNFQLYNTGGFGTSIQLTGNIIANCTSSCSSNGGYYGIYNNAASAPILTISANLISGSQNFVTNGPQHYIYNRGTVTTTFNLAAIVNNTLTNCSVSSGALSNVVYGINNTGVTSASLQIAANRLINLNFITLAYSKYLLYNSGVGSALLNISNNILSGVSSSLNTSGVFYGIYNTCPSSPNLVIGSNLLDNLHSSSTTGSKYLIFNGGSINTSSSILSNTLSNCYNLASGAASYYGIYNTANSSAQVSIDGNELSNNLSSTINGQMGLIYNTGAVTNTVNLLGISNNKITNSGYSTLTATTTNPFYGIYNVSVISRTLQVVGNLLDANSSSTGYSNRYLILNTANSTSLITISGNTLSNSTYTDNTTGLFFGISNTGASAGGTLQITGNLLNNLALAASSNTVFTIHNSGLVSGVRNLTGNTISNTRFNSNSGGAYVALFNQSASSSSLSMSNNTITNLNAHTNTLSLFLILNNGTPATNITNVSISGNQISNSSCVIDSVASFYGIYNNLVTSSNLQLNANAVLGFSLSTPKSNRFLIYNTGASTNSTSLSNNVIQASVFSNSLNSTFQGIYNAGNYANLLFMSGNSFSNNALSTNSGSLFVVANAANSTSLANTASLNTNTIASNSISSNSLNPIFLLHSRGNNTGGLDLSSNTVLSNIVTHSLGSVYGISNFGTYSNSCSLNLNSLSSNTISTAAGTVFVLSNLAVIATQSPGLVSMSGNLVNLNSVASTSTNPQFILYQRSNNSNSVSLSSNTLLWNSFSNPLGSIYTTFNSGNFSNSLGINSNVLSGNVLATNAGTLFTVFNSGMATGTLSSVAINSNSVAANALLSATNSPCQLIYQSGTGIYDLSISNNAVSSNSISSALGATAKIYNSAAITNSLLLNSNYISANTNTTPATGDYFGIYNGATNTKYLSVNSNTFIGNSSFIQSGQTNLIYNTAVVSDVIQTNNNQLAYEFNNPIAPYSGPFHGIYTTNGTFSTQIEANNNSFSNLQYSQLSGLALVYFIRNTSDASNLNYLNNSWTNLNIQNAAGHYFMHNTGNVQQSVNISNNSVNGYTRTAGASADLYVYYANGSSVPATCVQTYSSNSVSNITSTVGGVGSFYGIYAVDGGTSPYPLKTISNNLISNINYNSSGDFLGIYANYLGDGLINASSSIHSNTISNVGWSGNVFGIFHGLNNSPNENLLIHLNTISNLSSSGSSSAVYAACLNGGGLGQRFFKNRIYAVQASGNNAKSYGIYVSNAATTEISNNRLAQINAPNSGALNAVNGIYVANGNTVSAYYNTVYLDALASAPNFNSNAIFENTSSSLTLRNNIFINNSVANGNGISAAFRRNGTSLSNYAQASNNNILYAGTSGTNHVVYYDPNNSVQTLAAYQTLMQPRELGSKKENTGFLSTLGNNANFLQVNSTLPSQSESGANNISGILDDFDAQIRQGNPGYAGTGVAPDIGSDEYNQNLPPCNSANAGTISPVSLTICAGQNITLNSTGFTYTAAGGIVHQWQQAAISGGPYSNVAGGSGANSIEYTSQNLSAGVQYFILLTTCTVNSQTSVSNQATVVVNPVPSVTLAVSASTLCTGQTINFSSLSDIGLGFSWQGPNNFTSTLQNPSIGNASTNASGVYSVFVSSGSCTNQASISTTVYATPPSFLIQPSSTVICLGSSQTISASASVASPTLNFNSQANQNLPSGYPAPYSVYYGGQKMQVLVTSSELLAAGFSGGSPITSVEFPVVALGASWGSSVHDCQNFQINIGHSTLTSLVTFQSGLTNVVPATNYTPVVGPLNNHMFTAPFIWDGSSNLIIETLFSNNMIGNNTTSVIQYNSPTGFQSTVVYRADNQNITQIAAATNSNVNVGVARPNFKLNGLPIGTYTWVPSTGLSSTTTQSTTASPLAASIYTAFLSNGNCSSQQTVAINVEQTPTVSAQTTSTILCVGNIATLTASGANTYSWSNGATNSVVTISPNGNTNYVVVGINFPCPTSSAAISISVIPAIVVSAASSSPVICAGQTSTLFANGASSYTWSNGVNTSSTVVSPSVNTSYTVVGSNGPGCFAQQVLPIISNSVPLLVCTPPSQTVCLGESINFSAAGAISYTWLPANLGSSNFLVIPNASTTYTLIGQAPNNCKLALLVPVGVDECVSLSEISFEGGGARLYPNPSNGSFYVEMDATGEKRIEISNSTGAVVYSGTFSDQLSHFQMGESAKGLYFVKLYNSEYHVYFKLILN